MAARRRLRAPALVVGLLLALGSIVVASAVGPSSIGPADAWTVVVHKLGLTPHAHVNLFVQAIVWDLRLPRNVLAALVGAGLAVAGAVMQAVTRNPLADPYLLGLSSGASLGAVVVLVLPIAAGSLGVATGAFLGAPVAFALAVSDRSLDPAVTVLAGVAVGTICEALTSLIVVVAANTDKTRGLDYWLLGSLAGSTWDNVLVAAPIVFACVAVCMLCARSLNPMAFGDAYARALGSTRPGCAGSCSSRAR